MSNNNRPSRGERVFFTVVLSTLGGIVGGAIGTVIAPGVGTAIGSKIGAACGAAVAATDDGNAHDYGHT